MQFGRAERGTSHDARHLPASSLACIERYLVCICVRHLSFIDFCPLGVHCLVQLLLGPLIELLLLLDDIGVAKEALSLLLAAKDGLQEALVAE